MTGRASTDANTATKQIAKKPASIGAVTLPEWLNKLMRVALLFEQAERYGRDRGRHCRGRNGMIDCAADVATK